MCEHVHCLKIYQTNLSILHLKPLHNWSSLQCQWQTELNFIKVLGTEIWNFVFSNF
jgi:hypothetical protein